MKPHGLLSVLLTGAALGASAAPPVPPAIPEPPAGMDQLDVALCRSLAAGTGETLAKRTVTAAALDLDGDGQVEQLSVADEGTAHVESYQIRRADGRAVEVPPLDLGYPDGAFFGGSVRWLVANGRAYVLTFAGRGTGYLAYASRITGAFRERPLCRFQPHATVSLRPARKADAPVCRALGAGKVRFLPPDPLAAPRDDKRFDPPGGTARLVARLKADVDNSRRRSEVFQGEISSGAGAGCEISYYDTAAGRGGLHPALMRLQGMNDRDTYPSGGCRDDRARWFRLGNRVYLETRSTESIAPTAEAYEYHTVSILEHGRARTVCKAAYTHPAPRLTAWWDGAAWTPSTSR
ncbi:MAG TPA: hypothetical protein VG939_17270 [Caulobacteraceae bacterium]|nr:hypothetical protein [Caulobacteraceae bacterium]